MQNSCYSYYEKLIKQKEKKISMLKSPQLWLETISLFRVLEVQVKDKSFISENKYISKLRNTINNIVENIHENIDNIECSSGNKKEESLKAFAINLAKIVPLVSNYKDIICILLTDEYFRTDPVLSKISRTLKGFPDLIIEHPHIIKLCEAVFNIIKNNFSKLTLSGGKFQIEYSKIQKAIDKYHNAVEDALLSIELNQGKTEIAEA